MTNELPTQPKGEHLPRLFALPAYLKKVEKWNRKNGIGNGAMEITVWSENTGSGTKTDPNDIEYLSLSEANAMIREARAEVWKEAHDACVPLMKSEFMALTFIKASEARKEGS